MTVLNERQLSTAFPVRVPARSSRGPALLGSIPPSVLFQTSESRTCGTPSQYNYSSSGHCQLSRLRPLKGLSHLGGRGAKPSLQLPEEYGAETDPRGAALLSAPTTPKPQKRSILVYHSQDSITVSASFSKPRASQVGVLGQSPRWPSWGGRIRPCRGVCQGPVWNMVLEVQEPATAWGRGLPLPSPTRCLKAESLLLAVGEPTSLFTRLQPSR